MIKPPFIPIKIFINNTDYIIIGMVVFMKGKYFLLISLSIFVIFLVGCRGATNTSGYATTSSAGVKEFNTAIQNFQYNPESINVNFGDRVKINIKNNDGVTHGISLPIFGVREFVRPGQTTTIQFVANQRGNPETFCSTDHGEKLLIRIN